MTAYLSDVPAVRFVVFLVLLCLAAGMQANVSLFLPYAEVTGRPDFVLTFCLLLALLSDSAGGCGWGMGAGVITAALAGQTVGSFLVSRTVAGYVAGGLSERFVRTNPIVIVVTILIGTVVADAIYLICNPPLSLDALLSVLRFGGMNALWNAALALPFARILHGLGWIWDAD